MFFEEPNKPSSVEPVSEAGLSPVRYILQTMIDIHPGLTPGCQTSLCCTRDELDTVVVDSVTGGFAEKLPDADDFYQGMVSSDEEDFSEPDDGSVADFERYTWAD